MDLLQLQGLFLQSVAKLIFFAGSEGYLLTAGEAYRTKEQALWYAERGLGIKGSLHCQRLAMDFNVFKGSALLTAGSDFTSLGDYWTGLSVPDAPHFWGGHFGDAGHFSISPDNGLTK